MTSRDQPRRKQELLARRVSRLMAGVGAACITTVSAPNFSVAGEAAPIFTPQELMGLSLEDLSNLQITSVSRREQSISDAPASIYVITADDIRRSGATSLPEVLRLAPNLQVARIDSVQYAISARGFNNSIGNKLLVLLDGRTIYTPLFSGVFWEMEDAFLQDIERVEVISGPGATLWGANAVNGVINIITRPAAETQGVLLVGAVGDREYGGGLRIGGTVGSAHVRAYVKARTWDNTNRENGTDATDSWDKAQAGFRADWNSEADSFTLQGDVSEGESGHRGFIGTLAIPAVQVAGANLLGRWTRELASGSGLNVQAYWSRSDREEFILFSPKSDIVDLEFTHDVAFGTHHLVWGGGYRYAKDDVTPGVITAVLPAKRSLHWQNIFAQDEWQLADDWTGTLGIKLEWNDYTGMEYLPNARLAWAPSEGHLLWSSISRAVRAPSRFDRDVYFPKTPPFIVAGGPDFEAEVAKVVEVGYRGTLSTAFTMSATAFRHDWEKLRSGTPLPLPTYLSNDLEGEAVGLETWLNWQPARIWRVSAGLTTLDKDLQFNPGGSDTRGPENPTLHNDPDFQWMLRSSLELGADLILDMNLRRVDELTVEPVPAYSELDVRLAWVPSDKIEVALVGRNLLHNDHAEFGPPNSRSRIDRSVLLGGRWLF
jgi:iron complex outermembrane receptor protein